LIILGAVVALMMAAVMAGGMIPPLVIALSTTLFSNRGSKKDRSASLANYIIGSAVAGSLTAAFRCASPAPHGACVSQPSIHIRCCISSPYLPVHLSAA
jgi:PTS system fructose-specific IIC component